MSDWGVGYASGIVVGLVIGFVAGRRREPWSALTDRQRKITMILIATGVVLLLAGIAAFFLYRG